MKECFVISQIITTFAEKRYKYDRKRKADTGEGQNIRSLFQRPVSAT